MTECLLKREVRNRMADGRGSLTHEGLSLLVSQKADHTQGFLVGAGSRDLAPQAQVQTVALSGSSVHATSDGDRD